MLKHNWYHTKTPKVFPVRVQINGKAAEDVHLQEAISDFDKVRIKNIFLNVQK